MPASNSDGSIVIDTGINTKGFEKGSDELLQAIRSLTAEVNRLGQVLLSTFNGYGNAVKGSSGEVEGLQDNFEALQAKAKEMQATIEQLKQELAAAKANGDISPQIKVDAPRAQVVSLEKELQALSKLVDGMGKDADKAIGGSQQSLESFEAKSAEVEKRIDAISKALAEYGNTNFATKEFEETYADIEKTEKKLQELENRRDRFLATGGRKKSVTFKRMQYDIEEAQNSLKYLKGDLQDLLDKGQDSVKGSATPQFATYSSALEQLKGQLAGMKSAVNESISPETPVQKAVSSFGFLQSVLMQTGNAIKSLGPITIRAVGGLARLAGGTVVSGLKRIATAAKDAAFNLARAAKNSVISGFKKLGSTLLNVGKHSRSSNMSLGKGVRMLLRYGLGIRSLFVLFNKLRRALVAGFQELAKHDGQTNQSISNLQSALATLKNQFAASFAPIANIVLPILTNMVNAMNDVVVKIGQFVAALTGQKTFIKAQAVQKNYAASLDNTAEAAKEAKKQLAGFDDVEILSSDNSGSSSGSGDSGGGFETYQLDDANSSFAQMLKDAWANSDFTDVGKMIGSKLQEALASIPWDGIKEKARNIAQSIATLLNGFLEAPELFTTIGTTLAQGLNTVFEFANTFVHTFNWAALGTAIQDLIVGTLSNIDWALITNTLATAGAGLGTTLNTALGNPEVWNQIFLTLTNGFNAAVIGLTAFIATVNWFELASSLATGVNTGIGNIDWNATGEGIATAANALFDALNGAIETLDWGALAQGIIDAVMSFFENFDWNKAAETVGALVGAAAKVLITVGGALWNVLKEVGGDIIDGGFEGILDALANVGKWIKENIFDPFIEGFKKAFGIHSPSKEMEPLGDNIIQGMFEGIKGVIKNVGKWIESNIFEPFMEGVETAFAIVGGVAGTLKSVGEGIMGGIQSGIESAQNFISEAAIGATGILDSVFGEHDWGSIGSNIVSGISNGIGAVAQGLYNTAASVASNVLGTAKSVLGIHSPSREFAYVGRMISEGLEGGIEDSQDGAVDAIANMSKNLISEADVLSSIPFKMPSMASGSVVPYASASSAGNAKTGVTEALASLAKSNANAVTRDDLRSIIGEAIQQYLNIDFYIGDETIAKHANAGNARINRRYKTTG